MINEEHPLFQNYKQEWDNMVSEYLEKMNKIPHTSGFDNHDEAVLTKELHKRIKKLQEKYKEIF